MKRTRSKPQQPSRKPAHRLVRYVVVFLAAACAVGLTVVWRAFRPTAIRVERVLASYREDVDCDSLSVLYPLDGTLFPPEIIAPVFRWQDPRLESNTWLVSFEFADGGPRTSFHSDLAEWTPARNDWEEIKRRSLARPAKVTILGIDRDRQEQILSAARISIGTSPDQVAAPIFYREVDLPFLDAVRDPAKHIRWRFGTVDSPEPPPIVLENLPVCANCHSFSRDGGTFGMDVDYANDKGSYIVRSVARQMTLDQQQVLTWNDFRREDKQPTFGLLSQVSPDGRYVVSTVKDRSVFLSRDELAFSQLFYPVQGILAVYDRRQKTFFALPGADEPQFVQSNPTWSPDGKYLVFARSKAYHLPALADSRKVLLSAQECPEDLQEGGTFQFDLYRIPFNGGQGGQAEPLAGASHNGQSNYFAKYSPDGKWIVFCRARSFMLLQPDSQLHIIPAEGGEARRLECNTPRMNSWHSWSPNGRWLVFSSKVNSPYTQLLLTHIDADGNSTPPVLLRQFTTADKAANIPEFVNAPGDAIVKIEERFLNEPSYIRAGWHNLRYNDFDLAVAAFQKALEISPNSAAAYEGWGVALQRQNQFVEARNLLSKSLELQPDRRDARNHLGQVYARLGNTPEAIRQHREALRLAPQDAETHMMLGSLLVDAGSVDEAKQNLAEAARLDPKNSMPHVLLGIVLVREGSPDQADVHFRNALKIDPACVTALLQRSSIKATSEHPELRDCQEAIRLAEQACELTHHKDPGAMLVLAVAYHEAGRAADAVQTAEIAFGLAQATGSRKVADAIRKRLADWQPRP
jgi:Flp pilus assembly protein TadD